MINEIKDAVLNDKFTMWRNAPEYIQYLLDEREKMVSVIRDVSAHIVLGGAYHELSEETREEIER